MSVLAYLDPGSGSLIAATAAAGLAGVSVAAKSVWHRRTSRFRKTDVTEPTEAEAGTDPPLEESPVEHEGPAQADVVNASVEAGGAPAENAD